MSTSASPRCSSDSHVFGQVLVFGGHLGDRLLPFLGLRRQVVQRDLDVEHVFDPAQQRYRRLRVRRLRHIVRHRRPERHRRDPGGHTGVLEHPGDPGRALVAGFLQSEALRGLGGVGRTRNRHRPGVRCVGQQGAEDHDGVDIELVGDGHQLGAERAPAHIGLDPVHQHDVAVAARWPAVRNPHRRPHQLPRHPIDLPDDRAIHLVVVVRLVIDLHDRIGFPDGLEVFQRIAGRVAGIVPSLERRHDDGVVQFGQRGAAIRGGHRIRVRRPRPATMRPVAWAEVGVPASREAARGRAGHSTGACLRRPAEAAPGQLSETCKPLGAFHRTTILVA